MTKKEFLKNFDLRDELEEFLKSGHDDMWLYCYNHDFETLVVCRFLKDAIRENVIEFDEFRLSGLDSDEDWRDLMEENEFFWPKDIDIWPDGVSRFEDYLNSQFRWDSPLMYDNDPNWDPDLYEYIELEENEKEK